MGIGLLITLVGFVAGFSDPASLLLAAVGLIVMAFSSPGSLEGAFTRLDRMLSILLNYKLKQKQVAFL